MRRCRICGIGKAPTTMCDACDLSCQRYFRSRTKTLENAAVWAAARARRVARRFALFDGLSRAASFVAGYIGGSNQRGDRVDPKRLHDLIIQPGNLDR